MSSVSELVFSIQEEIDKGVLSFNEIATKFEVPLSWVDVVATEYASDVDL